MNEQGPADGRVDAGAAGAGGADGAGRGTQERRTPGAAAAFLPLGLVFVILGISWGVGSARIPFILIGATFLVLTAVRWRTSRASGERGAGEPAA